MIFFFFVLYKNFNDFSFFFLSFFLQFLLLFYVSFIHYNYIRFFASCIKVVESSRIVYYPLIFIHLKYYLDTTHGIWYFLLIFSFVTFRKIDRRIKSKNNNIKKKILELKKLLFPIFTGLLLIQGIERMSRIVRHNMSTAFIKNCKIFVDSKLVILEFS